MDQNPEPLTYTGHWWLADAPDQKATGTLAINPGGKTRLSLLGKLGDQSGLSDGLVRLKAVEHGTILGHAKESGAYKPITLYGCFETRFDPDFVSHLTGVAESTLTPEVVLVGVHFVDRERAFGEFEAQLLGLESWTRLALPSPTPEFDEAGKVKRLSHRFEPPRPTSFELPQGGTLSFPAQFSARKNGVAAYAVAYRTPVALKADGGATLDWFIETVHDVQVLISILMGRAARTVELKGRVRHEPDPATRYVRFEEFRVFFRAQHGWARLPDQQPKEDELLALPQLEDDLPAILSRWFGDADKFRQAARLYHDNLNQPGRFTALRFLTTAQAVETVHRRLFGESHFSKSDVAGYEAIRETIIADLATTDLSAQFQSSLKDKLRYLPHDSLRWRLKDLWKRSGGVLAYHIPDRDRFCEAATVTRDYLTHHSEELEARAADGLRLAVLTVQLEVMLVTTFLLTLGVSNTKVGEAVREFGAFEWIRRYGSA